MADVNQCVLEDWVWMGNSQVVTMSLVVAVTLSWSCLFAHEHSLPGFQAARRAALTRAGTQTLETAETKGPVCQLQIDLVDASTGKPLPGQVRILTVEEGKAVPLPGLIQREMWFIYDFSSISEVSHPGPIRLVEPSPRVRGHRSDGAGFRCGRRSASCGPDPSGGG